MWPDEWREIDNFISRNENERNVYFCISLLRKKERKKENCPSTALVWADLDEVTPESLGNFLPPITVESSDGRWQAYWRMSTTVPPLQAEEYSRRIAYHAGADTSGWDLVQLMRVPMTRNFKHEPAQAVLLRHASEAKLPPLTFEKLLPPTTPTDIAIPADDELPSLEQVLYKYGRDLGTTAFEAVYTMDMENALEADWSKQLWRLHHICLGVGMSVDEAFVVAKSAPCNKYSRDGRPDEHLWQEIVKAEVSRGNMNMPDSWAPLKMPHLVDSESLEGDATFIEDYTKWAVEATDAIEEYHRLSAFMVLTSVISTSVRLPCSYHPAMVPNLWGMVLGDSTLSRKTTAMGMARDLILMPDPDTIVATDGTPEGLLTSLEQRPGKTSVFLIDEVSGFFESINRKEYQAGMRETLTYLYDSPPVLARTLRKERIVINSPMFILFCGGISDHVYEAVNENYVISGFLPRFLVVSGEADMNRLRDTHRPDKVVLDKGTKIKNTVADLNEQYAVEVATKIGGATSMQMPRINADLTDKAWDFYGHIERTMRNTAADYEANRSIALPTFERLSRSILKMSVLLAATHQEPTKENTIEVSKDDVAQAAWYVQNWGEYSIDLIMHAGTGRQEKQLEKMVSSITANPGIHRGILMRRYKLSKREADDLLGTMEDRGLVRKEKIGRGTAYWPA